MSRIEDMKRFRQIVNLLFKEEFGYYIATLKLKSHLSLGKQVQKKKFRKQNTHPERIRKLLEKLGGTFVKLGQLLSLRPDLIPVEYCEEFRKLRDEVPAFETSRAKSMIEKELGKKITSVFSRFQQKPVASASIAQVYVATLKKGGRVAVKIQRPGIREMMSEDIDIMMYLAKKIEKHIDPKVIRPTEIVHEFRRYTDQELDFVKEGRSVDKFNKNFSEEKDVVIPEVHWDITTQKLLVLSYVDGKTIDGYVKNHPKDRRRLADILANSIFKQIFIDGLFHADPHPGNIFVTRQKKIAFLDFGIVGYLDDDLKEKMSIMFIAMIKRDLDMMAESLVDLGFGDGSDINTTLLKEDMHDTLGKYYDTELRYVNLSELFPKLIELCKRNHIKLPPNFVLFTKSMITLQGTERELDPEFNLVKTARPFVDELVMKRSSPKAMMSKLIRSSFRLKKFASEIPDQAKIIVDGVRKGDKAIDSIDKDIRTLTREIDRSSNRISYGVLIAGFAIAGALMMNTDQLVVGGFPVYSFVGFTLALFLFLILIVSILREHR